MEFGDRKQGQAYHTTIEFKHTTAMYKSLPLFSELGLPRPLYSGIVVGSRPFNTMLKMSVKSAVDACVEYNYKLILQRSGLFPGFFPKNLSYFLG